MLICLRLSVLLCRVYSHKDRHDLELLKTPWLIEEFEQNYQTYLTHLLTEASELNRYLEQLVAVLTLKKRTCKKLKKLLQQRFILPGMYVLEKKNKEKLNIYSYKCLLFAI